jgi:cytochrome c
MGRWIVATAALWAIACIAMGGARADGNGQQAGSAAEANLGGVSDAERGRILFERRCTGCHAIDANREGPHLRGVFGRKAGSVPDFTYSPALKQSGVTWQVDSLNKWLIDPDAMIPENNMDFSVAKEKDRADLIAFLKQLQ